MAQVRHTSTILLAPAPTLIVAPGAPAMAAACTAADPFQRVTMVPFIAGSGSSYLFTYRDQNNVQKVWPARRDNFGVVRSYAQKSLPKAGK
jgi:hypothetical protein